MSDKKIRVMIVDDHDVVREGLSGFLRAMKDISLVGEAGDGVEAVELYQRLSPDVVLMDVQMPRKSGLEATAEIYQYDPQARVIILTSFGDDDLVQDAIKIGAIGYLLKNASVKEMVDAIRAASVGKPTLSVEATQALIRAQTRPKKRNYHLKERELEVLALLVSGRTNDQISLELDISRSTVKFHVSSILAKLNVESRTEAVSLALREGLLEE